MTIYTVFNYWEALHYLDRGYGFRTWEYAPEFAIRSWAYLMLHLPVVVIPARVLGFDKVRNLQRFEP